MTQLFTKFWAKAVAALLFTVLLLTFLLSVAGVVVCAETDAYLDGGEQLRTMVLHDMVDGPRSQAIDYFDQYRRRNGAEEPYLTELAEAFSPEETNYFFAVKDAEGNELFRSGEGESQYSSTSEFILTDASETVTETKRFESAAERQVYLEQLQRQGCEILLDEESEVIGENGQLCYELYVEYREAGARKIFTITDYVRTPLTARDNISVALEWTEKLVALRQTLIGIGAASLLMCIALLGFLLAAAGRREGEDGVHLTWFDRIPLDVVLVLLFCAGVVTGALVSGGSASFGLTAVCVPAAVLLWGLLLLLFLMSFAVRVKTGTLWKNTVIYRICRLAWRFCSWLWHGAGYLLRELPLYWKAGLAWAGLSFVEMLFLIMGIHGVTMLWLLEKLAITPLLALVVINMRRLQQAGERIAAGEVDYTVDLTHMIGDFRVHGEDLNRIRDGLQTAVDERVKSERMKAELITNVSHDIKTPLTSIVSYVDLLEKEDVSPARAREYVEVLSRQAQRLKKLTEDLVEASKASTGNIPVTLERTDLNVLLAQAAGEFADRFAAQQLDLRVVQDAAQPNVLADGRLLWRVFSNLMSNIVKYALEGTRVYLSTEVRDGRALASFKNISRYPLNVSGGELMERFVRGDKSRSTEGSGLGLSIARSLTELQGGAFDIVVDGDLFKATISFNLCES